MVWKNVRPGELLSVWDSPFPLLAAALGVDKDEQRVSVWHGADLSEDKHVLMISHRFIGPVAVTERSGVTGSSLHSPQLRPTSR